MRILYAVHKYDYAQPQRGYCYEHYNFYQTLLSMGHEVAYFDFPTVAQQLGRQAMNHRLLETVKAQKPDVMFTVAWGDYLDHETVRKISQETDTATVNWFCDDHWKFDQFSRLWAPCFNWVVTTAQCTLEKYARIGYQNVIKSQWACNHLLYRKLDLPLKYDVTFVGIPHGVRGAAVKSLRDAGIDVRAWGQGWEAGRLSQQQMIEVFNQSRVSLNFSADHRAGGSRGRLGQMAHRYIERPLNAVPGGWRVAAAGRALASKVVPSGGTDGHSGPRQIKGRVFEVPGCGGFLLTGDAENLNDYYRTGQEMLVFNSIADLIEKIRYYLDHEQERAAIAQAGYQRTLREHTYVQRFTEIFKRMGLAGVAKSESAVRDTASGETGLRSCEGSTSLVA